MTVLEKIASKVFREKLATEGPAATFPRLCTSKHVDDLQSIALYAIIIFFISAFFAVYFLCRIIKLQDGKEALTTFTGLCAAASIAIAWTYQVASKRLGAVDLFASEIMGICRVCLVLNFPENSISMLGDGSEQIKFGDFENYTPAHDNIIADLQPLDFEVVTAVTDFYTYRKAMIDLLRKAAKSETAAQKDNAITQMIYMQYLMYESGRRAVRKLIEFEPTRSDSLACMYSLECALFGFLIKSYSGAFQGKRLRLRSDEYIRCIPVLLERIEENFAKYHSQSDLKMRLNPWIRAHAIKDELGIRYDRIKKIL